ncbi:MAG: hypothetical protein K8S98_05425 [Planctomycetes bacterium]|nr:hypothetical protein [Planctomycetota bacterium]
MNARVRFQLAVDDAGEFLVAGGRTLTLGHAKNRAVDLPVLADLYAEHARFEFRPETFHQAASWRLTPTPELLAAGRDLAVDGRPVGAGLDVGHGQRIEFSPQLAARLTAPAPASSTFLLEFERGAECLGAQRILLFAPGPGGLVVIGRRARSHARVARLPGEIRLFEDAERLVVVSDVALRVDAGEVATEHRFDLPLDARRTLSVTRADKAEPPFFVTLAPAD